MAKRKETSVAADLPEEAARVRQAHLATLQDVIVEFQFLEEGLRTYINHAYDIIRIRAQGLVPFKRDRKALEGRSLGRLIEEFSTLVDDSKLVEELNKLVRDRNHCAHAAFMQAFVHSALHSENLAETTKAIDQQTKIYNRAHVATGKAFELMKRIGDVAEDLARRRVVSARRHLAAARKRAAATEGKTH